MPDELDILHCIYLGVNLTINCDPRLELHIFFA